LADQSNNDSLTSELESRLDDLFSEDDAPPLVETETQKLEYPLSELKNLVLSIDWEITDEALVDFISQVKSLKAKYQDDKIILMFLQILGSLGEYIKAHRGKAHPKTFKILNSVFARLDAVVRTDEMSDPEKKKNLHIAMKRYKLLRKEISKEKAAPGPRKESPSAKKKITKAKKVEAPVQKQPPEHQPEGETVADTVFEEPAEVVQPEMAAMDAKTAIPADALAEAVNEIKAYIHSEIAKLREELIQSNK
jgi:hypothetical protein